MSVPTIEDWERGWGVPLPGYHKTQQEPLTTSNEMAPGDAVGVKHDKDKPRFDLIPPEAEYALAAVLTFGAKKYAPDNWRKIEGIPERYRGALRRHLNAMQLGEERDAESGLPHSWHALVCLSFIVADSFEKDIAPQLVEKK